MPPCLGGMARTWVKRRIWFKAASFSFVSCHHLVVMIRADLCPISLYRFVYHIETSLLTNHVSFWFPGQKFTFWR